jgi:hypothetical protein
MKWNDVALTSWTLSSLVSAVDLQQATGLTNALRVVDVVWQFLLSCNVEQVELDGGLCGGCRELLRMPVDIRFDRFGSVVVLSSVYAQTGS